jgi:hypothetical protein
VFEVETAVEAICPSMLVAALKLHIEPENVPIMFEMVPIAEHVDEQPAPMCVRPLPGRPWLPAKRRAAGPR